MVNQRHEPSPISLSTVCLVAIAAYFCFSASLKMDALGLQEKEKSEGWIKCLESYTHQVCSSDQGGETSQVCSKLFDCIKEGSNLPLPQKTIFVVESMMKEAGTIGVPLLLIYLLIKGLT